MLQAKASKCCINRKLPKKKLTSLLVPKFEKLVNKKLVQGHRANPTLTKFQTKNYPKTTIDQGKNKMHEDKENISFEDDEKSAGV